MKQNEQEQDHFLSAAHEILRTAEKLDQAKRGLVEAFVNNIRAAVEHSSAMLSIGSHGGDIVTGTCLMADRLLEELRVELNALTDRLAQEIAQ